MTIDDRLTQAGQRFRDTHTVPAAVHLVPPAQPARPAQPGGPARRRRPRPGGRTLGIAVTVCAVVALTAGMITWVASSGGSPRPTVTTPAGPTDPLIALTTGTWRLTAVDTDATPTVRPTIRYTLTVAPGSQSQALRLDDGCNLTTVPVVIDSATIRVTGDASTTLVECSAARDPAVTALAPVFGAATISWSIAGTELSLNGGGVTATFAPVTPSAPTAAGLDLTSWQLVGVVDGGTTVPAAAARSTDLRFDATAGQVVVGDGCNSITAGYAVDGSGLVFTGFATTAVACSDDVALQRAVERVFEDGSATVERADDRLTLRRDGLVLTYDLVGVG